MRALRLLVCLVTSASIAVALVPARAVTPLVVKAGCCATMKMDAQAKDCGHHAPKSDQEKDCCAACLPCVAILSSTARPFVYPSTGEESFAPLSVSEHARSHRPPVPPPRA